ncbi:cytochrome c3 family protein [Thermodesulfobacteriota bacterium]
MYKHFSRYLISGIILLFLISCSVLEIKESTTFKLPASPEPGDCIACHKNKKVLSQGHVDTRDMTGNECGSCHEPGETSLRTNIPLGHMHQLEGVSCKGCHEDPASAKAVDSKVCQKCHSDEGALIEAAKELEINPHFSPHEGKVPDCNRCHHQHRNSENYCAKCHGMEYKVP